MEGRPPAEMVDRALSALAAVVSEEPWRASRADLDAARGAGLSDAAVLHAVVLASFFNYLNRVADAIDLELDYPSPLPKISRDAHREPTARPPRSQWPKGNAIGLRLSDRPETATAFARWKEYVLAREAPLSRRDRQVLCRAAVETLCDDDGVRAFESAPPTNDRERTLAAYARKLSVTPWRMTREDLDGLRAHLPSDEHLLDVVSVSAYQTTASRLWLLIDPR